MNTGWLHVVFAFGVREVIVDASAEGLVESVKPVLRPAVNDEENYGHCRGQDC